MNDFLMKAFQEGALTTITNAMPLDNLSATYESQYAQVLQKAQPVLDLIQTLTKHVQSDDEGNKFQYETEQIDKYKTTFSVIFDQENASFDEAEDMKTFVVGRSGMHLFTANGDKADGTEPYQSHHEPMKEIMRWTGRVAPHMEDNVRQALKENPINDPKHPRWLRDFLHDGSLSQEMVERFGLPKEGREIVKGWESTKQTNTRTPK